MKEASRCGPTSWLARTTSRSATRPQDHTCCIGITWSHTRRRKHEGRTPRLRNRLKGAATRCSTPVTARARGGPLPIASGLRRRAGINRPLRCPRCSLRRDAGSDPGAFVRVRTKEGAHMPSFVSAARRVPTMLLLDDPDPRHRVCGSRHRLREALSPRHQRLQRKGVDAEGRIHGVGHHDVPANRVPSSAAQMWFIEHVGSAGETEIWRFKTGSPTAVSIRRTGVA